MMYICTYTYIYTCTYIYVRIVIVYVSARVRVRVRLSVGVSVSVCVKCECECTYHHAAVVAAPLTNTCPQKSTRREASETAATRSTLDSSSDPALRALYE